MSDTVVPATTAEKGGWFRVFSTTASGFAGHTGRITERQYSIRRRYFKVSFDESAPDECDLWFSSDEGEEVGQP